MGPARAGRRTVGVLGVALLGGFALAGCKDKFFEDSAGSPAPRLSASLREDAPGAARFTLRVLVIAPSAGEYLGVAASSGATIAVADFSPATNLCTVALGEQVFAVTSTPGTPTATVALGTWAGSGLPPATCASVPQFQAEESLVASIPSAAMPAATDAGLTQPGLSGEGGIQ